MTKRQEQILKAIVENYINEAEPVGSKVLDERYDFGVGPAMIRQEMAALEKMGYLSQPHTSAGRVPTDKAYRLYIGQELNRKKVVLSAGDQEKVHKAVHSLENQDELNRGLARTISEISHELSVAGVVGGTHFIHGFSYLTSEPEFEDGDFLSEFMRFMDGLDRSFGQLFGLVNNGSMRVFIGEENPIRDVRDFTIITSRYYLPQGAKGFVSIIGPKRMDYRRNMALVEYVSSIIKR